VARIARWSAGGAYFLPLTVIAEETVEMVRNVLCLLGRHHWVRRQNEDYESYTECRRCGKYKPVFGGAGASQIPPGFGGG
jgi:hypothetical protein